MEFRELEISGCYLATPNKYQDLRGSFVKTYLKSAFEEAGINFSFKEEYVSVSKKGVIRGMHFQTPPYQLMKIVYCPQGEVFDAFVDLRKQSATYLKSASTVLSEENAAILILAEGIAHGFCSLRDETIMVYKTSSEYVPESDAGILWNSCGVEWPSIADPELLSERDKSFVQLKLFDTPF